VLHATPVSGSALCRNRFLSGVLGADAGLRISNDVLGFGNRWTDIGICVFSAPSQAFGVIGWFVFFSLIQAPPPASRLETPFGRSFIHVEIFTSHEVGRPVFDTSFVGVREGGSLNAPVYDGCGGLQEDD